MSQQWVFICAIEALMTFKYLGQQCFEFVWFVHSIYGKNKSLTSVKSSSGMERDKEMELYGSQVFIFLSLP